MMLYYYIIKCFLILNVILFIFFMKNISILNILFSLIVFFSLVYISSTFKKLCKEDEDAIIVISNFISIILSNIFLLFHIISLGYYLKMNIGVSCILLGCIYTSYVNLKRI